MRTFVKTLSVLLLLLSDCLISFAQVGINTDGTKPDTSAMLDVKSTTLGLLVPRMTQTQRNLIYLPASGLIIFQTDQTPGFYFYNGSAWQRLIVEDEDDWTKLAIIFTIQIQGMLVLGHPPQVKNCMLGKVRFLWRRTRVKIP